MPDIYRHVTFLKKDDDVGTAESQRRFEEIYTEHYAAVSGYVRRRTDHPDDCADVIAETFTTAWRRLADLPAGDEVRLWLYGAARRILANQRRGTLRRTALTLRLREELSAYAGTTFDQAPEGAREAFARLSDDDRELLSLVGWEELSPTEIAKVLGCSRVAVRQRLHRARKRLAPDPGPGLTPGAREMLTQIMDMAEPAPRARRTRWRPLIVLPIAAALAGAGWSATVVLGATPAAALDIKDEGDHYLIEVKDLYANSEVYETQLNDSGLDISLKVVPVSPSLVGEISPDTPGWSGGPFPYADKIKTIDRPEGCDFSRSCPIGLTIAKDFTGKAEIKLGRKGRPGEEYQAVAGLHDRGEPLHCKPFYNRRVGEVRGSLAALGISITDFSIKKPGQRGEDAEVSTSVPDSMYVTGGGMSELGKAFLVVSETPMDEELMRTILRKDGCAADEKSTS
ncbi:sigma-70 family RNA polymerase sigma factor [Nonomuraea sp. NPDC049129]|uniref:RNA polymerase sigma factor n=1 Tax=Nonomuraea sp. NPDC049129 TaxID=3155272 RepID=UPI003406166F